MISCGITHITKNRLMCVIQAILLCTAMYAEQTMAVPAISISDVFTPADSARDPDNIANNGDEYMDSGGVWNGTAEVTNTTGDAFAVTISNTAAGAPDAAVDDIAFDISLSLAVPAGFRLPVSPFTVSTAAAGGDPVAANCVAPGGGSITASQPGGAGSDITFNIPADTNLPAQGTGSACQYTFNFGLTTNDSAPLVVAGNYQLNYSFSYNEIDDDAGSQQSSNNSQSVEVRSGDIIIVKSPVNGPGPNGSYADGESAQWDVSVFGNGSGGSFAVVITDTPSANFNPATLQITPDSPPPPAPPLGTNQYTIPYLQTGQTLTFDVNATVAIPPTATACPDLRNDVSALDRLNNSSAAFAAVEFNLEDPLLAYAPNDITVPFGGTDRISFNVQNTGTGSAKNISLNVTDLSGFTVSNIAANWTFNGSDTFTYTGGSLASGASVLLAFDVGMGTCGGPAASTLTWTPNYENLCGTAFTPPIQSSTITVVNDPTIGINKTVAPLITNFGQPASYTINLTGASVTSLPTADVPAVDDDDDWSVTDTLPAGVSNGIIPSVPAGTTITIGATTFTDADTNIAVTAGDVIQWQGDREDLTPLPSITVNFDVDSTPFCPPNPPIAINNVATLDYPSCGVNVADATVLTVNDSPVNSSAQNLSLISAGPFETGRPDTDGIPANEANEGEHIQFEAVYRFPAGSGGTLAGTSFVGDLASSSLAGNPLSLINSPAVVVEFYSSETATIGVDAPIRTANIATAALNNATGTSCGIGAFVNGGGAFCIADLDAVLSAGTALVDDSTLVVRYTATAPEGTLDAINTGLPVGGVNDPLKDNNIGIFTERSTIAIATGNTSCSGGVAFTQGLNGVTLERATPTIAASINGGNDFDICGPVNAVIDIGAPLAGTLNADNIRIEIDGTNYGLVVDGAGAEISDALPAFNSAIAVGGVGNLSGLSTNISRPLNGNLTIEVTPNGANLTGDSNITFPVQLLDTSARNITGTIFYDSNHTSPDFVGEGSTEDYSASFSITPAAASANLDVEFFPPNIILGDPTILAGPNGVFDWRVRITNVGVAPVSDYVFTNLVPTGYIPDAANSTPNADQVASQLMIWETGTGTLPTLAPGASTEIIVAIQLPQNGGCNVGNPNVTSVQFGCNGGANLFSENGPNIVFPVIDLQVEHQSSSFCELCRDGTVELEIRNEGASDLYDVVVNESLVGSGLEYIAGSTEVFIEGSAGFVAVPDHPSTTSTQIVWDSSIIADLGQLLSELNGVPSEMTIRFGVRSDDVNPENLVNATRDISATGTFDLFCGDPGLGPVIDNFQVPLNQPQPQVDKLGRNYSARQGAADYADTVFGGSDDLIIWQVDIANSGVSSSADLEDLLVVESLTPNTNLNMLFVCPSDADATAQAASLEGGTPGAVAPCVIFDPNDDVDDPFGNPGNDEPGAFIDAAAGSSALLYYVSIVLEQCTNETNSVEIEWGCEVNSATDLGGINADGSGGNLDAGLAAGADDDTSILSTEVNPAGVQIQRTFTGTNPLLPVGTNGILTITVTNNSGGTIRDLVLTNTLPVDYEIDLSAASVADILAVTPAFGTYPGIVDQFTLNSTDPNAPVFTLTSSTSGSPNQVNLMRNGDEIVFTIRAVRIGPFDDVNDPEVRTENSGDGTDPDYSLTLPTDDDNNISLNFDDTCSANPPLPGVPLSNTFNVSINPEDLDIDINPSDPDLLFVLSDPTAVLNLDVVVRNNGGHIATNYDTYVTIGSGINPGTLPSGCTGPVAPPAEIGVAPSNPGGILPPEYNPADSQTFRCIIDDPMSPGDSDTFSFVVERMLPLGVSGDLTFRADLLARTVLNDGSAPPDRGVAGYPYYSKDNVLARIIGFNLFKNINGNCSEDNPPPSSNANVIIGEECEYEIEAEWFGFATPGFGNIEIRNARIYEGATSNNPPAVEANPASDPPNLPDAIDGQGFISIDTSASSSGISVAAQNPAAPAALAETGLAWRLNNIVAVGNTEERFIARVRTRNLNDALNSSAAPNVHAANITDEANVRFDVFFSGTGTLLSFDETVVGYPPLSLRSETIVITEPNITLTKEVCNESISIAANPANSGINCTPFAPAPSLVMGDSDDNFIFRLTVANEANASGVDRAPAYDVVINDAFDATDQIAPLPFATDGLDNDGDGLIDGADAGGEGTVDDTTLINANPADLTFDGSHSSALLQIDPGDSAVLFYRARLDPMVTPTQQLINTANGTYDSLAGASGAQSAPLGASGTIGGARQYTIADVQATVELDNITINPGSKEFTNTARRNAGLVGGVCASPCVDENVVVGEEIEVELEFTVPLSELRSFSLEDNLPAGIECIEALDINLPAFPGADPGFVPGGTFPAVTCDANQVRWDLSTAGDQVLQGSGGTMQFDVQARFIARVQNTVATNNNDIIANGGTSTNVLVSYLNASNTQVNIPIAEARLTVQEPVIAVTKTMAPVAPATTVDANDIIDVTVQVQNNGTSPAYNLRLLEDLTPAGINLSYIIGSEGGANVPDVIDVSNPAAPRFTFNNPLAPTASLSFTFQVRAADTVQPLEELDNTVFASFTSLPNNTVALNSLAVIGLDGAPNGMRIGALPAAGDAVNDYEAQGTDFEAVPPLSIVKNDLSPALPIAVGARKNFAVVLDFPEGVSNGVVVNDDLAAGATSFILENNASFDVSYSFQDIVSINGNLVSGFATPADVEAALAAFTAIDGASGTVSWNFASVVTAVEEDPATSAVNPRITINYFARVANDVATIAGATLQNAANANYTNGENAGTEVINAPPLGPFAVVEPDLVVTKTGPATMFPSLVDSFTVTAQNVGTATAWDVTITDQLPDLVPGPGGMCDNAPVITAIDVAGRVLTAGVDFTTVFNPAPTCTFLITLTPSDAAAPANNARIDAGETLTIVYDHVLDNNTPDAISLTNIAGATQWLSQDTDGVTIPAEVRAYNRTLTDGTTAVVDHEDAHTLLTQGPVIGINKTVENLTSGQAAAVNISASPGDTLRFTLLVDNTGPVAGNNIRVFDDPELLNTPPGYFENFPAGTLSNVTIVGAAGTDNSLISGGVNNAGFLDVMLPTLAACPAPPACPPGSSVTISFDITLDQQVLNAATLENSGFVELQGFDATESNTVQIELSQSPALLVEKTAQDQTGDLSVLASGDELLYSITVRNIANENATNVTITDQIPANTSYVANSTTLNGAAVADVATGVSPLSDGLLINSVDNSTAGFLTANPDVAANNVATITFTVRVDNNLVDGTIISNQARVTGTGEVNGLGFIPILSDDPGTALPNDPTQVIVGVGPIIDAQKTVAIVAGGADGTADPGDTLRYTMTVINSGNSNATAVTLRDAVPANTTYVPNSVVLNGLAVPDAAGSPLVAGIPIASADLTPPLPNINNAIITAGNNAVVTFEVTIDAGVSAGAVITNQGFIGSAEQPEEPTDQDGNDENGDQPTDIIVGGVPELEITKEVVIVGGGTAQAGGVLEYVIRIDNIGPVAADNIVVSDVVPANTVYVPNSGMINGVSTGVSFASNTVFANYSSNFNQLQPGNYFLVTFRVQIDAQAAAGTTIDNTASVSWNDGGPPNFVAQDSASVDVGGAPGVVNLNGLVWHDSNHNDSFDSASEVLLQGWQASVYFNNPNPSAADTPIATAPLTTDIGAYAFNGLPPGGPYTVTFTLPGHRVALGDTVATNGNAGLMLINNIIAGAGSNVLDQSLTVEPNGVVYNSISRVPVAGATVSLVRPDGTAIPDSCFNTPAHLGNQQGQVTQGPQSSISGESVNAQAGFYRFDLNYSDPVNCPNSASDYIVNVIVPNTDDWVAGISGVLPPESGPLNVDNCTDLAGAIIDAVPPPPNNSCDVLDIANPPDPFTPRGSGTRYYLDLQQSSSAQDLFNNHIPLDPVLDGAIAIAKTTPLKNVVKGQLVPYTITLTNTFGFPLTGVILRDNFPAGFKYVEGSAIVDNQQREPMVDGLSLNWGDITIDSLATTTVKLLLIVGSGVGEGEYVNTAQSFIFGLADPVSGLASATVRVVPDPTFDCSDIIGKVYDDRNANGYPDAGEPGIAGARVVTAQGLITTADKYGRFHIVCAAVPNADRGSNFIVKLDERSLPSGYRVTTENPRVQRLTRGKAVKFNFGASLHRVVRLDLADAAFVPAAAAVQEHWQYVLDDLIVQLREGPSVLRLSYLGDTESAALAKRRLKAIEKLIKKRWNALNCCYNLPVETELYWRTGKPGGGR